jgi:hypothetical protein
LLSTFERKAEEEKVYSKKPNIFDVDTSFNDDAKPDININKERFSYL